MRIEVLIGNEDPVVYPLKSAKVTLGTSENCDIILNADGVSRKHITILTEGDNFYVIDQGSTNGSYINEERLIPGRKTEFTSFFPVRLGDNVLITLISDEEAPGETKIEIPSTFAEKSNPKMDRPAAPEGTKTTVIPLRELDKVKTEKLIQNRDLKKSSSVAKKRAAAASAKSSPAAKKKKNLVPVISLLIVIGAGVYNIFFMKKEAPPQEKVASIGQVVQEKPKEEPKPKENFLIAKDDLTPKENYQRLITDFKCTTDTEILLCDSFPGAREESFGVVQTGLTAHIMVNASEYLKEAVTFVPALDPNAPPQFVEDHKNLVRHTAAFLYLIKLSETPLPDPEKLKDLKLSIALMTKKEDGTWDTEIVIAMKPEVLPKVKDFALKGQLAFVRTNGVGAFAIGKDFYTAY